MSGEAETETPTKWDAIKSIFGLAWIVIGVQLLFGLGWLTSIGLVTGFVGGLFVGSLAFWTLKEDKWDVWEWKDTWFLVFSELFGELKAKLPKTKKRRDLERRAAEEIVRWAQQGVADGTLEVTRSPGRVEIRGVYDGRWFSQPVVSSERVDWQREGF